ncbi:conserved secreted protein [Mycobacteroides abscessus subsp. abscessus]|nr:conserved secreted protein [Mycobacteroides abscessus subsp. abscessus]
MRFDASRGVWQMSYLDTARAAIVVREATTPQGAWSAPTPTVSVLDYPELYGGFIHPWSSGSDLYFNITTWSDYNVYLMHAELAE